MTDQPYLEQPDLHTKAPFRAALLSHPGNLKEALRQGQEDPKKVLFGVAQGMASVFVTKVLAATRPDFIWLDAEHALWDRSSLYDCVQATQYHSEGKAMAIVRVAKNDLIGLSTALDAGAAGIVLPHCESAEEVKHILKEIYYPPLGQRSFSPWTFVPGISDASLYKGDPFNMGTSNRHIVVIAQIESVKGVENVEEIAAIEGVGALMFGPGDFMADAGLELKLGGDPHPTFLAAMGKFAAAGKKFGKPLFGASMSADMIPMMIAQGYAAIAVAFDMWGLSNLVASGMKEARAKAAEVGEAKVTLNGKEASS